MYTRTKKKCRVTFRKKKCQVTFTDSFKVFNITLHSFLGQKKRKIDFQDGPHGSHLGFQIGMILAIFDLQVTSMLPTKFQVSWKQKIDFQDGSHLGLPLGTILAIFYLQVTSMLPTRFRVN